MQIYKDAYQLGWDAAFEKTFGMTATQFYESLNNAMATKTLAEVRAMKPSTSDLKRLMSIGSEGATEIFDGESTTVSPTPDLNGDGKVGFPDFLIFAAAFGKSITDEGFTAAADLTGDGKVGFPDFLIFAAAFGKPAP